MANPSHWAFRRGHKWHSSWRDENSRCHSKAQPAGAGRALAQEYARKMAIEASQIRAGQPVRGKEIRIAMEAFLARENVKTCTHGLNRQHLESFINHFKVRTVDELSDDRVDEWLGHPKALGCNPGGQSL